MSSSNFDLCGFEVGLDKPLFLIAGPCVIESEAMAMATAESLKKISEQLQIPFIYKSSFDKANRTSSQSYRGPGMAQGLEILQKVKDEIDSETSSEDWPTFNGAKVEPNVFELSMSEEIPILNINISGDYPVAKLKEYAEFLEDEIEDLSEIKQVDIRGAQEKEVEVDILAESFIDLGIDFKKLISDFEEKQRGLEIIMKQHGANGKLEFEKKEVEFIVILKLSITSMTGKQSSNWNKLK